MHALTSPDAPLVRLWRFSQATDNGLAFTCETHRILVIGIFRLFEVGCAPPALIPVKVMTHLVIQNMDAVSAQRVEIELGIPPTAIAQDARTKSFKLLRPRACGS